MRKNAILTWCVFLFVSAAQALPAKTIKLPEPRTEGGIPLMQALKKRQSVRTYAPKEIPAAVLSDLLWAACGINRPSSGMRTNPTAKDFRELEVYVVRKDGAYRYDPVKNELFLITDRDIRQSTGKQDFVLQAPVNLVFVADLSRMSGASAEEQKELADLDCGFIAQNVYLYCASEGLATVVRGWFDRDALGQALSLGKDKRAVLCQSVGYPVVK